MSNPYRNNDDDLDELLREVDDLLVPPEAGGYDDPDIDEYEYDDLDEFDPDDVDEYAPNDLDDEDGPMLYQNYSNNYGADVQNFANGYGGRQVSMPNSGASAPNIPAYNADFKQAPRRESVQKSPARRSESRGQKAVRRENHVSYEDDPIEDVYSKQKPQKSKKRRKGCGCGCTTMLLVLAIVVAGIFGLVHLAFRPPKADTSIGDRKKDTAAVLLCGVDEEGTRTDTMMLMYMSGSEHKVGLLSIPRDTYIITSGGYDAKLNSAYGLNNCGEEGMEGLFDHIEKIIGYRPDGYILVDFSLVPQITDLMGGVDVNVPTDIQEGDINLAAGMQHLNGKEILTLLRHRSSYAMADLTRVEVQREVIKACMEQWLSPSHLKEMFSSLKLVENNSTTSLSMPNYLWMGKTILMNMKNFSTDTLPGYATMIDGSSYYVLYPDEVAQIINSSYNPYKVEISQANLDIAG